jgi:hypothetical protein
MEKYIKYIIAIFVTASLVACASNKSVNEVFNSRIDLVGKKVNVKGILLSQAAILKLCQKELGDDCLNLEVSSEDIEILNSYIDSNVLIEGIYLDHEYVERNGELSFFPSRLQVVSFEKQDKFN